jgi:uncharacterized protein YcbK (DUF882 family)
VSRYARSLKLTPHFAWGEFWQAGDREPPPELYVAYVDLARRFLEPLRLAFGVTTIASGYRTPEHNRAVGGAPASVHMGRTAPAPAVAADVVCRSGTPRLWYDALARLSPGGLGLYVTHVHVDNRRGPVARW